MSGFRSWSLLFLMLLVPAVALGGSVSGAGAISGAGEGQRSGGGSLHDSALERPSRQLESGEVTGAPRHDEMPPQESADEMQKMTLLRPDWQRIVGKTGSATVYRRWLAKQPKAYQRMIESASTAAELNESIEEFLASDDAREAAHLEELDIKLAEMRARAQEQGRYADERERLK